MAKTPHTMTYMTLPDAPGGPPVYQCCGQWCYQASQAMFHLWHEHGFTAEAAWAQIDVVRGISTPAQPLPLPTPHTPSSVSQCPQLDITQEKQALIDESVALFRAQCATNIRRSHGT